MTNLAQFTMDPSAVLPFSEDWTAWLNGDTITAVTVVATAGITVNSVTNTATLVTAVLSGGTSGINYTVTFHITTAAGLQDDRSITINCRNR
jgi:hypothetical protein